MTLTLASILPASYPRPRTSKLNKDVKALKQSKMIFSLFAVSALTSYSLAQTTTTALSTSLPSPLPACAEPALVAAVQASGCQPSDVQCICSDPSVISSLTSAVQTACDSADQAADGEVACGIERKVTRH